MCELSNGVLFSGPPRRPRFPVWAGVLIGVGIALLAVGVFVTVLLLRRRAHITRRDNLEVPWPACYCNAARFCGNHKVSCRRRRRGGAAAPLCPHHEPRQLGGGHAYALARTSFGSGNVKLWPARHCRRASCSKAGCL